MRRFVVSGPVLVVSLFLVTVTTFSTHLPGAEETPTSPAGAMPDRVPIPLRQPAPQTPIEAAGTGVTPAVAVKVEVDEGGRVADVQVTRVDPSTDYDEYFAEAARETLSTWRYAPAIENGQPIGRTLEWTIQFVSLEDQPKVELTTPDFAARLGGGGGGGGGIGTDRLADEWARILALSEQRRLEMLQELVDVAVSDLDRSRLQRVSSPRFVVFTDYEAKGTAEKIAGNMEATFRVMEEVFGDAIVPRSERYKLVVLAYGSSNGYRSMTRAVKTFDWSAGVYHPAGMIAFHLDRTNPGALGTMIHEGVHAYVDRYINRRGVVMPRWLGEGLAEYFGNSEIRKGQLIPGRTSYGNFEMTAWGVFRIPSSARLTMEDMRQAVKERKAPRVAEILSAGPGTFYGPDRRMYYGMSWLMIHFLRHGRPGWDKNEFCDFFLYVGEGYPPLDAFETVYGASAAEFEEEFRTYVRKF